MPDMLHDPLVLAIAGVALGTFALRLGGLLLAERLPKEGPVAVGLQRLPGIVLLALVVPAVVDLGTLGVVAAAATGAAAVLSRSPLLAMVVGAGVVAVARMMGLG